MADQQIKTAKGVTYARPSATSDEAEGKVERTQLDEIIVDPANQDAVQGDTDPYVDGRQSAEQGAVGNSPAKVFALSGATVTATADDDTPANDTSPVVTAALSVNVADVLVKFVRAGVNGSDVAYATTDANGDATYVYLADITGEDTVTASVPNTALAASVETLTVAP